MKKKCVFLTGILLLIFITYACEMPSSIEFKSERFEMNAPVKIGSFNLATVLSEALKSSFPEGFEIYDMVNYRGAQAFLIAYPMDDMLESFNPDDYLDDIKTQVRHMDDLAPDGIDPIYPESIVIPKMTTKKIEDKWFYFDMAGFFQDMEGKINTNSTPETHNPIPFRHPAGATDFPLPISEMGEFANIPPFMVFDTSNNGALNFDSIFVDKGIIVLQIWLEINGAPDPDFSLELTGIDLKGANDGLPIGTHSGNPAVINYTHFNEANSYRYIINIDGAEIYHDNPPKFHLGGITSMHDTGPADDIRYTLHMKPKVGGAGTTPGVDDNITLSGARNLKIGVTREPVPDEISDEIVMASVPDMLNADIASGKLRIEPEPPQFVENSGYTGCTGMTIGYELVIEQAPVQFEGKKFYGLGGEDGEASFIGDKNSPSTLAGMQISGGSLNVKKSDSKIVIRTGENGVTFELSDDKGYYDADGSYQNDWFYDDDGTTIRKPLFEKVLPIKLNMGIDIDELKVVRWKRVGENGPVLPEIKLPPINFATLGTSADGKEDVSFLQSITFKEIILNVDFTVPNPAPTRPSLNHGVLEPGPGKGLPTALKSHIALKVNHPKLGFEDPHNTQILQDDTHTFTSTRATLDINDHPQIEFEVELIPVVTDANKNKVIDENSKYIEFGPVAMGNDPIEMNIYAEVDIDFEWEEAVIDVQAAYKKLDRDTDPLKGTYPKDTEEPVDLSEFGKYMKGITLSDNIKAKIFLGGPRQLIEIIQPTIDFSAQWKNDNDETIAEHLLLERAFKVDDVLPKLLGKTNGEWVYPDLDLPEPGRGVLMDGSFGNIIASFPQDLRFSYAMKLPGADNAITVYPHMFDDVEEGEDSKLKALLVIMLPLELVAKPGGYFSIPSDMFGGSVDGDGGDGGEGGKVEKDLFDRQIVGAVSPFTGVNIKSLGIKIDFGSSPFSGSNLLFDMRDILFGPNGLPLGDGNTMNVIFTSVQQRLIEENLIYPDIRFKFPYGKTMKISRDFLPIRIVISANGSYTLNLDDLFESGN